MAITAESYREETQVMGSGVAECNFNEDVEQSHRPKRKRSSPQERDPRPSKRTRKDDPVQQTSAAGPSSSGTSTNDSDRDRTTDPERTTSGRFRCRLCEETFVAKHVRDRHTSLHEVDRIVYVCKGRRSERDFFHIRYERF